MVLSSLLLLSQWLDPPIPLSIAPYSHGSACDCRVTPVGGESRCPQRGGGLSSIAPALNLSPAMIQSPDFPMRRESSDDLYNLDSSASPEPSQSTIHQEVKFRDCEEQGNYSPQAVVAGRLAELAIRGDIQIPDRSLHQTSILPILQTNCFPNLPTGLHGSHDMSESLQPSETAIERPHPPTEHTPPTSSPVDVKAVTQTADQPSVNFSRQSSISPRKKRSNLVSRHARGARGSSPLLGDAFQNLLTWNDSEITGHNPTDPDDDGYGLNGIGFKPTAAISWARSQKRQKQVAEWKYREAREARERRRERRDANDELEKLRTVHSGAIQKKVKFNV